MGELTANAVDPIWLRDADAITWVPASKKAYRRRGFDHAEDLARAFADAARASGCSAPVRGMLARPQAADQRGLTRAERAANVAGRFRAAGELHAVGTVILVDDVCTTGSTLVSAANALAQAGVATIRCVVFARTM